MHLTPQQVSDFDRDGCAFPFRVLSTEQAAHYRHCLEQHEAIAGKPLQGNWRHKTHLLFTWADRLVHHPKILDAVENLIGPDILCWGTSLRAKAADGKTFAGWHQDTAYAEVKPIVVIVALALSPSRAENGCIRAIPGSHRGPLLPHKEAFKTDSLLSREQYIDSDFDRSAAVDLALESGEIALFNNAIVHGSNPNFGADRRILFLIEMVPTRAWQQAPRESAALVRGSDAYGNFDVDPPPRREMGAAELAAWQRAVEIQASVLFRGAQRPPRALAGMTSGKPPGGS